MTVRDLIRDVTPPLLPRIARRWMGKELRFAGRPATWAEATSLSSGYAATDILERVTRATRAVVAGTARYERDSVLFNELDYPFPLLAALLRATALNAGQLHVIDFGGSLGSTYRQCRPLLAGLPSVRWCVVEQPSFVEAGQQEFSTEELSFAPSLSALPRAVCSDGNAVLVASSVLQYLEDPSCTVDDFARAAAKHLIVDRTPFCDEAADRLCIQHVPKQIYPASYPCWIFSRERLLEQLEQDWKLVCEFPCAEGIHRTADGLRFEFKGLVLERKG